ncbi:MAG: RdgB/HAM1 family non-canonical purine NTP pyrophosphatase [Oscillospiraceae bacterium]|jgi:XTP/dITP diphosphohydrolase|nr:RdgB/HAM1 family non-canonical purine NTP pyrophosphatase [Oscillospiraceae bacterium]
MKLVAATGNLHKLKEFKRILTPLGVEVLSPEEAGISPEVEETGETFKDNARLKALAFYREGKLPAIADDSGLCVDALGGRPGVRSARYRGEASTYPEKFSALLGELSGVPPEKRTARFVCAICCVLGEGEAITCEESCEGFIGYAPDGEGGFGYDPLFYIGGRSVAGMSDGEKDMVSHRAKALRRFSKLLEAHIKSGLEKR